MSSVEPKKLLFPVHLTASRGGPVRSQYASLSHAELDMPLLGQLMAASNNSNTVMTVSGHSESTRKKVHMWYSHQGVSACSTMFRFLRGIGHNRMKNLAKSFKANGLTPRIQRNTKRLPKWTLSLCRARCSISTELY